MKQFIHLADPVIFRGKPTIQNVWFQFRGKQRHFFKQIKGHKVQRITDPKEKESLIWSYQRYYPDGTRI